MKTESDLHLKEIFKKFGMVDTEGDKGRRQRYRGTEFSSGGS